MLILVGVTVTVALKGGLFETAKKAAGDTEKEKVKEQQLASGRVQIDGLWYNSTEDYANNNPVLPDRWTKIEKPEGWTSDKVTAIQDENNNIVPLPNGFQVSLVEGEQEVEKGLVITDGENEFVWIPVSTTFTTTYTSSSNRSEPTELTGTNSNTSAAYDSQTTLNYYYGMKSETTPFYSYPTTDAEKANANNDFAYVGHYNEMVASVNKYHGFYIGRYETTINSNNEVGSKYNTTVLTADKSLPQTNNRSSLWWGLYYAQRNSNVAGNGTTVQTNMIWGQQWQAMLAFLDTETTQSTSKISGSQSGVLKSAEATYDNNKKDVMNNIYDLRRNVFEWTAEAVYTDVRAGRGR